MKRIAVILCVFKYLLVIKRSLPMFSLSTPPLQGHMSLSLLFLRAYSQDWLVKRFGAASRSMTRITTYCRSRIADIFLRAVPAETRTSLACLLGQIVAIVMKTRNMIGRGMTQSQAGART
jgi:hypothetical protein